MTEATIKVTTWVKVKFPGVYALKEALDLAETLASEDLVRVRTNKDTKLDYQEAIVEGVSR